jgi:hypothetical protein
LKSHARGRETKNKKKGNERELREREREMKTKQEFFVSFRFFFFLPPVSKQKITTDIFFPLSLPAFHTFYSAVFKKSLRRKQIWREKRESNKH